MARLLTRPWLAALLFSVSIAVWHLSPFYDLMMRNHDVHIATHLMFMVTATLMWWPVMSPLPELPPLRPGLGMLYLFLVGIPMQVVARADHASRTRCCTRGTSPRPGPGDSRRWTTSSSADF